MESHVAGMLMSFLGGGRGGGGGGCERVSGRAEVWRGPKGPKVGRVWAIVLQGLITGLQSPAKVLDVISLT